MAKILESEIDYIKKRGGASIFWITATQARAKRITQLEKDGIIIRHKDDPRDKFPFCVLSIHLTTASTGQAGTNAAKGDQLEPACR